MLLGMVPRAVRDHTLQFVVVLPSRVQVPIKAREGAARYLQSNSIACFEVVARPHRGCQLHRTVETLSVARLHTGLHCNLSGGLQWHHLAVAEARLIAISLNRQQKTRGVIARPGAIGHR